MLISDWSSDVCSSDLTAQDSVFNADGHGIGDIEFTARYQLPNSDPSRPYYVLWLRYKSRTGTDLFEVTTDCITRCVANATGTGLPLELPTGSGFAAVQPGVTWLYASDPVVIFGRSEEHTSELQSLMRISYAVFCLHKNKKTKQKSNHEKTQN